MQPTSLPDTRSNQLQTVRSSPNSAERSPTFSEFLQTLLAFAGLATFDAVLKVYGFRGLYDRIRHWRLTGNERVEQAVIERVCDAVDRAATFYPKQALCLQRSAVITCLLRRQGVPAELVIGVRKMPFHGHAWVEVKDIVVNDNHKVQQFYSLLERC